MAIDPAVAPTMRARDEAREAAPTGYIDIELSEPIGRSASIPRPVPRLREVPDARRVLNVAVAIIGIILAFPLAAAVAVAILLSSRGPIIYRQTRVGLDRRRERTIHDNARRRVVNYGGRLFTIYKFRTMKWDPATNLQIWASENDPRVTRLGRWLRRTRLDELPQLINVLKGDMNIVGPRPEQPRIFAELREKIERYETRQRVLPGLTGLAQVSRQYDSDLDDVRSKLRLDLEYVENQSCLTDLAIMLRTIPVVLLMKGGR